MAKALSSPLTDQPAAAAATPTARTTARVAPLLLAVTVGGIVISMYLPLFDLISKLS